MEEILHHLVCEKLGNSGRNYLSTGAGWLPSTVFPKWWSSGNVNVSSGLRKKYSPNHDPRIWSHIFRSKFLPPKMPNQLSSDQNHEITRPTTDILMILMSHYRISIIPICTMQCRRGLNYCLWFSKLLIKQQNVNCTFSMFFHGKKIPKKLVNFDPSSPSIRPPLLASGRFKG